MKYRFHFCFLLYMGIVLFPVGTRAQVHLAQKDTLSMTDTVRRSLPPTRSSSVSDQLLQDIIHPSPQSAAYARYGEYPVDYSTGVPKIDIPLYTLDTGDYQLPISISYHASGIKVTDVSSPVGLGWVLNAGGVISCTAHAVPDRYGSAYNLYFKDRAQVQNEINNPSLGWSWWTQFFNGFPSYDSETDRYAYNFPGKAGVFRYDSATGSIHALPHDPLKIEETQTGYKITDTDGTQYIFETRELCGGNVSQGYSAYYLDRIITGQRHNVITFSYGTSEYSVNCFSESYDEGETVYWEYNGFGSAYTMQTGDVAEFDRKFQTYLYHVPLLTSITWNGVTVSLTYTNDRLDPQRHRLSSLSVSDSGTQVRYVSFGNTSYFGNSTYNYRLKLSSLSIKGSSSSSAAESYSFTYNTQTPPDYYRLTTGAYGCYEDYWGYYNASPSMHVIPDGVVPGRTTADRTPAESYMKMCSLESITYPTGGRTVFQMEANRDGSEIIGGLRVASVLSYNYDGTLLEQRSYSYANPVRQLGISDDLYCWYDDVHYFFLPINVFAPFTASREHFFAAGSPVLPLTGQSGAPVNYLKVTEYLGGTAASNLGKNIYSFFLDTESSYPGSDEDYYVPDPGPRYYSNYYNNDEGTVPVLLSSKEVYRKDGNAYTKQQTESYAYTEYSPSAPYYTTGVRVGKKGVAVIYENALNQEYAPYASQQEFLESIVATNCRAYRRPRLLTAKTVTDHTTGVAVTTAYTYDSGQLRTLRPLSESLTNSDGKEARTVYTYPFGMSGSVYTAMTGANIVDVPVKEQYYYGGSIQRTRETAYGTYNSTMYLPSTLKETLGSTTRTLVTYSNYDSVGNLRYASTVDGRKFVFLWGYGNRFPVALIEGLTWAQVNSAAGSTLISNLASCTASNASTYLASFRSATVSPSSLSAYPHLVSTYTYTPGIGMTSETTPDGAARSYTYDALGRLTKVSDNQGEIETYSYSFASGSGTSWTPNRVLRSVKKNASASDTQRIESSIWYDGLGRPFEELSSKATPSQSNLLTRTDYDLAGRQTRQWLPVVTSSTFLSASAFTSAASSTYGSSETRPFSENVYEASALDRVPYAYGPGTAWYAASGGGHPVRTEWLGNTTSGVTACKYYYVNGTSLAGGSANYGAGTLSVIRTTDEDGAVSLSFTDKLGRSVLERQVDGSTYSDTYYVYDGRNQLRFVLQPQYQVSANLAQFAFQYTYNDRGNLTRKQLPGAGYVDCVYDSYDRLAYTQDGRQRAAGTNRWHFYTYDNLGRIATEGECTGQSSSSSPTVLIRNYYDSYSFAGTTNFPSTYFPSSSSWCIGRRTGQELFTLGSSSYGYVPRAWYYDSRGQVIKQVSGHHASLGYDTETTSYTYTGLPLTVSTARTTSSGTSGVPSAQTRTYSYDHMDRPVSETMTLNGANPTTLVAYTYDNLGRMATRKFAGSTSNAISYTYDIRSRMTLASHPGFIQDLAYTYGSDVSASGWKRSSAGTRSAYAFTYDGLHRLKNAAYSEGGSTNNRYTENVTGYDRNGNITALQRYGRTSASAWGVIDNLTLSRTGNLLTSVSDSGSAAYSGDFAASAGTSAYDANGSLISDTGRGISSVSWNEIGLPKTVSFSNGSSVSYLYAADGTKLREIRTVSGTTTTFDWCGNVVLEQAGNGTKIAKRLRTEEGYVDLTAGTGTTDRRYFVRDHLGSVRAVVDGSGTSLETDDYYPLGGPLPTGSSTTLQPEKYQGKDWNPTASFNVYDFGARLYDPALGRWLAQDPLAEKYYAHSPYLFCAGNPVRFVDPEGTSTRVKQLDDGTYEVIGGDLYDNDFGIYVGYYGDDGSWIPTKDEPIGYTPTLYSFYNSDENSDHGWQTGTIINPNDTMGASFLSTIRAGVTLTEYMDKARSGHQWDVKLTNNTEKVIEGIDIYRGMPIGSKNGIPVYASARDVGNIAAGIVAGAHGMSWLTARLGFDLYQSWSVRYLSVEGFSTQYAQLYGWRIGHKQWLDVIGRMNKDNYYAF